MRVLVTGAAGLLGSHVLSQLAASRHQVIGTWHTTPATTAGATVRLDLATTTSSALADVLAGVDAVVNAAYLPVGAPESASVNVDAVGRLADACALRDARLLHVSSDVVFRGVEDSCDESDPPDPLPGFTYGEQKAAAEAHLVGADHATVVRTSLLHDLRGGSSAERLVVASCAPGSGVAHFVDEFRCPVHVEDVAAGIVALLGHPDITVLHLGGPELLSRAEYARLLAPHLGLDPAAVPIGASGASPAGPRPRRLLLDSTRAGEILGWRARPLR